MTALNRSQRHLCELRLVAREHDVRANNQRRIAKTLALSYADVAGETHDQGDEALANLVTDIERAMTESECAELKAISAALVRLANGRYGTCVDCGAAIDYERLIVQPAAMRCSRCQTKDERSFARVSRSSL